MTKKKAVEGGDLPSWIQEAWDLTPSNGGSSFTNNGGGSWSGYVANWSGPGYHAGYNTNTGISYSDL